MCRKKQIKRGGGYDSTMEVKFIANGNVNIENIKKLSEFEKRDFESMQSRSATIMVMVTPTDQHITPRKQIYMVLRYIGDGTYGKVYLVKHVITGKFFVIKIQTIHPGVKKEATDLDKIMHGVTGKCKYVAISQGATDGIEHAVFPYLGSMDLMKMVDDGHINHKDNTALVPKIISNVIRCLNVIHLHGYNHLDIKLANIVFDEKNMFAHIIDYGLSLHNDDITQTTIGDIHVVNVGDCQLSVEMIIARFFILSRSISDPPSPVQQISFNTTFYTFADKIKQTSDNFGLFWLIIGLLTFGKDMDIYNEYIPYGGRTPKTEIVMLRKLFGLYHSLSLNPIRPINTVSNAENVHRNEFILKIRSYITEPAFKLWFNNDESRFNTFIESVFLLVHVDPEARIVPTELLKDPFFQHVLELWDAKNEFHVNAEQFIRGFGGKRKNKKRVITRKRKHTRRRTRIVTTNRR
jgi:serine/threonine protein kinase